MNESAIDGAKVLDGPERWRERLRRLGVPKLYQDARVEDFAPRDLKGAGWLFDAEIRKRPRDVLVLGDNGTGKTHLAAALTGLWGARFTSTLVLLQRVRRCFKPQVEETELSIVEDLVSPRVLVLDDVTAGSRTDFGLATILGVVAGRIDHERHTVVTSCQDLEAIDRLDSSLASRLAGFERVVLVGPDRRAR